MKKTGAHIILEQLIHHGTDTLFGYPGGAILPVFDALLDYPDQLTLYRLAHEQGIIHAADGYARATGKPGICFVTSGPGATNTVTGLATAFMDSVPLILFTGQVPTWLFGSDSFQEIDITSICEAVTKKTFQVKNVSKLASVVSEAIAIATSGRPGPVLIDLPKDVLLDLTDHEPTRLERPGQMLPDVKKKLSEVAKAVNSAWRPLIYAGGGVRMAQAETMLKEFAEKSGIPVVSSLMGLDAFPQTHPLALGMSGLHGHAHANEAIMNCDLLIIAGARFSNRATGKSDTFAPNATIVHLDIDDTEFSKNVDCHHYIHGDLRETFNFLLYNIEEKDHAAWLDWIETKKIDSLPSDLYCPQNILQTIKQMSPDNTIVVSDVGQHQMWTAQHWQFNQPNTWLTSGGLGTMGYGLGAAIGAQIGRPDAPVTLVTGDGSFMMNSQELSSVVKYGLPVTIVLINNSALGMVRQLQKFFYKQRYSKVENETPLDFVDLSKAYRIPAERVTTLQELTSAMERRNNSPGPYLIEVVIPEEDDVYPIVPAGKAINEYLLK